MALGIPIALLITGFALLEDRANRERSRIEVEREGQAILRAVQVATTNALRDEQIEDVHAIIDDLSGHRTILTIRLFDAAGALRYAPATAQGLIPPPDSILGVIAGNRVSEQHAIMDRRPVLSWLAPLLDPSGRPLGALQLLQHEAFVEEDAAASSRAIGLFALLLMAAIAAVVFVVTRASVTIPIEDLIRNVRAIGVGGWGSGVAVKRRDELGRLGDEFNHLRQRLADMQKRLIAEQQERRRIESDLRRAEQLASLGRFAAGVAHEIGTPLTVIGGRAEVLAQRLHGDAAAQRSLGIIAEQIERISRIVHGVLDFARAREPRMVPTDVGATLAAVVELLAEPLGARGVRVETARAAGLPCVAADPDQLQQVFLNLAMNAADAMPGGGVLRIEAQAVDRSGPDPGAAPQPCVVATFTDTGTGIAPGHLERLFEPFFTTKEVGGGTGLGLAISYGIVREQGGWIEVESEVGRGTSMAVCLPLGADARADGAGEVA